MRALLFVLLLLQAVPTVAAHAEALRTFPAPGATLDQAPAVVWVHLSEAPDPASFTLRVVDGQARDVPLGPVAWEGDRATAPLPTDLATGGYVAKWSAIDELDGHVVRGSWAFALGDAAAPTPVTEDAPVPWLVVAAKALVFVGLTLAAGGVATRALAGTHAGTAGLDGLARAGAWTLLAGGALLLVGQARAAEQGLAAYALGALHGRVLLARVVLAAATAAWLARAPRPGAWRRGVDAALLGASALGVAATSHAAATFGAVGLLVDAIHLAAIAAWTGGLIGLARLLQVERGEGLARVTRRFSALATVCVAAMAATGVALFLMIAGADAARWLPLLRTPYGILLALMVALGGAMAMLGAMSRFVHLARVLGDSADRWRRPFRLHVGREGAVGLAVLLVAAGLTNVSPVLGVDAQGAAMERGTADAVLAACAARDDAAACAVDVLMALQAERGPRAAFDVLADLVEANVSFALSSGHGIAHDLGRDALQNFGTVQATLSNCSERVFQGCIHGALQAYFDGLDEVRPEHVARACDLEGNVSKNARRNCIHGIGHGALVRTGFDVNASVGLCDALASEDDRRDCAQGIFMENMDSFLANRTGVSRESATGHEHAHHGEGHGVADPARPASPCDAVPEAYRVPCWTYQPGLLLHFNGGSFRGAMTDCITLPGAPDLVRACFGGVGGILAFNAGADPLAALDRCSGAPSYETQAHCVRGFVGTLVAGGTEVEPGLAVCRAAPEVDREACYEGLGLGARHLLPDDALPDLCRLAGPHEAACRKGAKLDAA